MIIRHIRAHLVAYVALFVALSGTGYAARNVVLPANSVGSAQVINHSLLRRDFKRGQLPHGSAAGRLDVVTADATSGGLSGTSAEAIALCPSGTTVVGGGFSKPNLTDINVIVDQSESVDGYGWDVIVHAETSSGAPTAVPFFHAFARCARLVAG